MVTKVIAEKLTVTRGDEMSEVLTNESPFANIGIDRFAEVSPVLYRGGQPNREQVLALASAGMRTIITLRWDLAVIKQEREWVKEAGINYVVIPLTYFILPTRKEIARFLEVCDDPQMQPAYVHCKHGVDRTGALAAIWRMARQDWTADRAYAEMLALGFHNIRVHHFKFAVYDFAERLERQKRIESSSEPAARQGEGNS